MHTIQTEIFSDEGLVQFFSLSMIWSCIININALSPFKI
jgi:hypothetical protein